VTSDPRLVAMREAEERRLRLARLLHEFLEPNDLIMELELARSEERGAHDERRT
jgi:hypothetical protein